MSIKTWSDYRRYLNEDLQAYGERKWRPWTSIKFPQLAFQRKLRAAEFALNCLPGPIGRIAGGLLRLRARQAGKRLGFSIPPNVFGPGLCIVHWGTIVVHDKARVGARCRLHPCTLIGGKSSGVPLVGDDVYIGNGAKIIGGVEVGSNTRIGSNAVVTRSFKGNCTLVGVPARLMTNEIMLDVGAKVERDQ
jgi:serine O-acetyltransferase